MEIVLLTVRLLLALIFGVAGAAKLADAAGTRRAMANFGAPEWLAGPLAKMLPVVEIAVAVALLPLASAWWGALGAAVLLLVFTAGIGLNLARGRAPDCHCFGQLNSEPVSWSLFARNLGLAALAVFIVAQGADRVGLSALGWLADLKAGEIGNLALAASGVAMLAATLVYLRKALAQQTALLEQIAAIKKVIDEDYAEPVPVERPDATAPEEGLPIGAAAPDFSLPTLDGHLVSLEELLRKGRPLLLLFVSPSCSPCKSLLPMLKVWERDYAEHLTVVLLSQGSAKEVQSRMAKYGARHLLLQGESEVAEEYQASWTPGAVVVNREGRIASRVSYGDEAIRALVNHTVTTDAGLATGQGVNGHIPRVSVGSSLFKVGEPAPRFALPNLQGREVGLETLLGTPTLLVFWDAQCPHCQAMAEDIKWWEAKPPHDAPKLVFIVSGNPGKLDQAFRSLILLDPEFEVGPLFGSQSTPSAVLIDGDGRIGSSLATGARNILALAGVRKVELPVVLRF